MLSIPHPVHSTALARPQHPVLQTPSGVLNASELHGAVVRQATVLATDLHIEPRQVVALFGPPSAQWIVTFHALGWLGATVMPLAPRAPTQELAQALSAGAPDCVVVCSDTPADGRAALAAAATMPCYDVPRVPAATVPRPERFWPLEETRLLMLTSGSTAAPRAIPLSTAQLAFSAFGSALRLGHLPDDSWLLCLPLHHVGGLSIALRAAWGGTRMILQPRFDAAEVAQQLDSGAIALVSLVPSMLEQVLDKRPAKPFPASLRAILLGGAPATPRLLERCRALGLPVAVSWGMTETASQVATSWPGEVGDDCGPPLAFARIEARHGLLTVRGPVVAAPLITSDRGEVDEHTGRVRVLGRRDDMILSGGENIAPEEIEAVLCAHPAVAEAVVVPLPDAHWGQRPLAVLVPRAANQRPSDDAMRTWCRARLASFKVPDRFRWCTTLPRNPMGKVQRRLVLRAFESDGLGVEPQALQRADKSLGDGAALEGLRLDKRVDQLDLGAGHPILADDVVREGHRAFAEAGHVQAHNESVAHADGVQVVGFAVHQGHAPQAGAEAAFQIGTKHGSQQLFKRRVAVRVQGAKKHDAGTVDIKKTGGDAMMECHAAPRLLHGEGSSSTLLKGDDNAKSSGQR